MAERTDIVISWENSFKRLKNVFFFYVSIITILGNALDIFIFKDVANELIRTINISYILFCVLIILTYSIKLIPLKIAGYFLIYGVVANILMSLIFRTEEPGFENLFLRESIIMGILLIPTGFILHRNHIISIGIIYFGFVFLIIQSGEFPFIEKSLAIIIIATLSYAAWLYYFLYLLEDWYIKQQELVNKLERRNTALDNKTKELNQSNNTKDRLLSIIAHDLKNPFNVILGFSSLLISRKDILTPEKVDKYVEAINKSASDSTTLLDNLLNWATCQTGDIRFFPERLESRHVLENIKGYFEGSCLDKEIGLTTDISPDSLVTADKNMLTAILRNLISNAIKFTHKRGQINIITDSNEDYFIFSIKDNGIGINEDTRSKLFQVEYENRALGTNREYGSGLGLIICKDFVEKHNGTISVESEPDKGSTFTFTLSKKLKASQQTTNKLIK